MAILALLTTLAAVLAAVFAIQFHWSRRKLYKFASGLPSPLSLPIVGHGYLFACKNQEIFGRLRSLNNKYKSTWNLWLGPRLIIFFNDLSHIETILSSKTLIQKSDIYRFLAEFGERGLITTSGAVWKRDRKLIQPLFNTKFGNGSVDVSQRHSTVFVKNMEALVGTYFDAGEPVHKLCFDIVGELMCGLQNNTQLEENLELMHCFTDLHDNAFGQLVKPWLQVKPIFDLSSYKPERDRIISTIYQYMFKSIDKATERIKDQTPPPEGFEEPIVDQLIPLFKNNIDEVDKQFLSEHLFTLYIASEDTMNITIAMGMELFGMYPELQDKALQEIREVLGESPREVTYSDINQMKYLDMCIKEILRISTIAPFILRKCPEDTQIGEHLVPAGCEILIPIFDIHRNPKEWSNPEHFHPDHFLPEAVAKRNPYSYLPFSMGPRSCIGKHLAITTCKVAFANILQHFRLEAKGKLPDICFRSDISVRPMDGYNVKLLKRT